MLDECSVDRCERPTRTRGYCNAHYRRWLKGKPLDQPIRLFNALESRLEAWVDKSGECWEWGGYRNEDGYGQIKVEGRMQGAHRVVYEHEIGPIPEGLELDHLCKNRACVNPAHLEPVTGRVNILRGEGFGAVNARKTYCIHGHPFDKANTHIDSRGRRNCRACHRERMRRKRERATKAELDIPAGK